MKGQHQDEGSTGSFGETVMKKTKLRSPRRGGGRHEGHRLRRTRTGEDGVEVWSGDIGVEESARA